MRLVHTALFIVFASLLLSPIINVMLHVSGHNKSTSGQAFKITLVPGENVEKAVRFIMGILRHLEYYGRMPVNFDDMLFDVFLASTIWKILKPP